MQTVRGPGFRSGKHWSDSADALELRLRDDPAVLGVHLAMRAGSPSLLVTATPAVREAEIPALFETYPVWIRVGEPGAAVDDYFARAGEERRIGELTAPNRR